MPNLFDLFGHMGVFGKLTIVVAMGTIVVAGSYAVRPTEHKLGLMRPLSLAAIFATISGVVGGWVAVLASVPATADGRLPVASLYEGAAESLMVGFVSFGLLAIAWMLVAIGGLRRHAAS